MARPTYRNHRSSPYMLDELLATQHRTAAGLLWRFRTELTTLALIAGICWLYVAAFTWIGSLIAVADLAVLFGIPQSRRWLVRRAWCVITRHRLQKVFHETRLHTRSGRLPLILRIHPTEVGEQALIWCRAGICFEDFEAHTGEIAAACYARETRVERSPRRAQLVTVNIVRRDTLAPRTLIPSGLVLKPATRPARPAGLIPADPDDGYAA